MILLAGQPGEVRFTVQVTRAETGKIETYDLVGFLDEDKMKELKNGSHTFDSSQKCSD
jgi:hypothetical protein